MPDVSQYDDPACESCGHDSACDCGCCYPKEETMPDPDPDLFPPIGPVNPNPPVNPPPPMPPIK